MELEDKTPTKVISGAMRQLGENVIGQLGDTWVSCLEASIKLDELQAYIDEMYSKIKALEAKWS